MAMAEVEGAPFPAQVLVGVARLYLLVTAVALPELLPCPGALDLVHGAHRGLLLPRFPAYQGVVGRRVLVPLAMNTPLDRP